MFKFIRTWSNYSLNFALSQTMYESSTMYNVVFSVNTLGLHGERAFKRVHNSSASGTPRGFTLFHYTSLDLHQFVSYSTSALLPFETKYF